MEIMPDRLTVARLMAIVAVVAVLLGSGLYWWEHHDVEQAMVTGDIQMISQGGPAQREAAAYGLGATSRGDPARIAALLTLAVLGDPEPKVRAAAANSLPRILTLWARNNQPVRGARMPTPPPFGTADAEATAVRAILRALNDSQPKVRFAAVEAWRRVQDSVKLTPELDVESGPALDRLLVRPDSDPATRSAAVWDVCRLQTPTASGRARVLTILRTDPDPNVQEMAVQAIMKGWTPQADLYPILLARTEAVPPPTAAPYDLWLLLNLPPPPPEVIPQLVRLMNAGGDRAAVAVAVLGKGGVAARPYLAQVREVAEQTLRDRNNAWLIRQTVEALVAIDPASPEAQAMLGPLLRLLLAAKNPNDRLHFRGSIARYGANAAPLVPDLRALLTSHNWDNFEPAAGLLAEIGLPAVVAIPDLEILQQRVHSKAVDAALSQLRQIPTR